MVVDVQELIDDSFHIHSTFLKEEPAWIEEVELIEEMRLYTIEGKTNVGKQFNNLKA